MRLSVQAGRGDDRCKVLIGAWLAAELAAGRSVALDGWLVRPGERLAVLGRDRQGSAAFLRVTRLDFVTEAVIMKS